MVSVWQRASEFNLINLNCFIFSYIAIEINTFIIFSQFFKIYKIDRDSSTKVGDWRSKNVALQIAKDSNERWKKANKERINQEWSDKNFWQKMRKAHGECWSRDSNQISVNFF